MEPLSPKQSFKRGLPNGGWIVVMGLWRGCLMVAEQLPNGCQKRTFFALSIRSKRTLSHGVFSSLTSGARHTAVVISPPLPRMLPVRLFPALSHPTLFRFMRHCGHPGTLALFERIALKTGRADLAASDSSSYRRNFFSPRTAKSGPARHRMQGDAIWENRKARGRRFRWPARAGKN
jgi:hypothetical protein